MHYAVHPKCFVRSCEDDQRFDDKRFRVSYLHLGIREIAVTKPCRLLLKPSAEPELRSAVGSKLVRSNQCTKFVRGTAGGLAATEEVPLLLNL